MFISFFDYMTSLIDAVKDKPDFIKIYGKDFMRAFREEMEYAGYNAIVDTTLGINAELDRIEAKYKFNEDMETLLSTVAFPVRDSVLSRHCELVRNSKKSKEAEAQVREFCRLMMDDMNHSVHLRMSNGL